MALNWCFGCSTVRKPAAEKPLSWATWLQENIPKGFGRFYPKNGGASGAGGKAGGPPKAAPKTGEKGQVTLRS